MPDEKPSLHIDDDWKKQAQEEKKRLAEQQSKAAASPAAPATTSAPIGPGPESAAPPGSPRRPGSGRGQQRELPPVSFATLVQSLVTQVLFYLGDLAAQGGEPVVNLDMAKHQIDTLTMLEEKTKNNLSPDEQRMMDAALYETRMRYVNVASQFT